MPVRGKPESPILRLSGWGRHPVLECRMEQPDRLDGLLDAVKRGGALIARGNGRSYGDAALNPDLTLSTLAMNRLRAFDASTGLLTCEAGVLLADIVAAFTPRGWHPPVVPGTKFVTVGGMIAADVHGKGHQSDGTFGAHVESLTLATGDGEVRRCSRTENRRLFRATLGGMGLTGVILAASIQLRRIETAFIREECLATSGLEETMAALEESRDWPYSVAWVDCLAKGGQCGRSLVSRATPVTRAALPARLAAYPLRTSSERSLTVPFDAPSALLTRATVGILNRLRHGLGRLRTGARTTHRDRFLFPLDRVGAWNRLYGRRGFVQYQCVVPASESGAAIPALLQRAAAGPGSFLGVLKQFGPQGDGLMSFPMAGHTLALDFPMGPGVSELLDTLDRITHAHGGRIYLAKDARCAPHCLREGYPQLEEFAGLRADAAGAQTQFSSALSQRLSL